MNDLVSKAVGLIKSGQATCIVINEGRIVSKTNQRGIKPIVDAYDTGILSGATVVDKVIGRAAAMIMTLGGVKECYALLISESAREFFNANGVQLEYECTCEYVINRQGSGPCPMESTVQGIEEPNEALLAVKNKVKELSNNA